MISNKAKQFQTISTSFGQIIPAPNIFTSSSSCEQPREPFKSFRRLRTTSNVLEEFRRASKRFEELRRASKSFEELRSVEQLQTTYNSFGQAVWAVFSTKTAHTKERSHKMPSGRIGQDLTISNDSRQQHRRNWAIGWDRTRSYQIGRNQNRSDTIGLEITCTKKIIVTTINISSSTKNLGGTRELL